MSYFENVRCKMNSNEIFRNCKGIKLISCFDICVYFLFCEFLKPECIKQKKKPHKIHLLTFVWIHSGFPNIM